MFLRLSCLVSSFWLITACAGMSGLGTPSRHAAVEKEASAYSQFMIARYASLTNDPVQAAESYARVSAGEPGDATVAERAVFSALLANDFDLAGRVAENLPVDRRSETTLPRIVLAADALKKGRARRSHEYLAGGDAGIFNGFVATQLMAWSAYERGADDVALQYLRADTGDPLLDQVNLNLLALMQASMGRTDEARALLEQAWASGAHLALGADLYARLLARDGEAARAVDMLQSFRSDIGHHPEIEALAAEIEAGTMPSIATLDANEGAARGVYAAAAALAQQSRNDLPGVYFAIALELDPDLDAARALWADTLDKADRRGDAIALLEDIAPASPFYSTSLGQRAWALLRDGRADEAEQLAARALAANPPHQLRVQLADLYRALGDDVRAVDLLSDAIAADRAAGQPDWRLYFARGTAHHRLGNAENSEADLETARALEPGEPQVLNYLGYSWIDRGERLQEGLALIREALMLNPQSGAITDSLGWAHYKLGEYDKAVLLLERASELDPGEREILDHLGDAYWQNGDKRQARFAWQEAHSLSDSESERAELDRKIREGLPGLIKARYTRP